MSRKTFETICVQAIPAGEGAPMPAASRGNLRKAFRFSLRELWNCSTIGTNPAGDAPDNRSD